MGRSSALVARRFVEWARIPKGGEILDVGCGTGALSRALVKHGVTSVVGIDPSVSYIEYARSHVHSEGNLRFETGDAMSLPFSTACFDAVVSGLVLNFISNPSKGVAEMVRVTKKGGAVAAYVWDYQEKMGLTQRFWEAAKSVDSGSRSLDEGHRFQLCRPENLRRLFLGEGMNDVTNGSIELKMVFRDFDEYWSPFLGGQGPMGFYLAGLSDAKREQMRKLLQRTLTVGGDGRILLESRALTVRGSKPT